RRVHGLGEARRRVVFSAPGGSHAQSGRSGVKAGFFHMRIYRSIFNRLIVSKHVYNQAFFY
ncbi:MAG: hypothetical protein ACK411_15420, partial [Exiguobacterium mexicanum]